MEVYDLKGGRKKEESEVRYSAPWGGGQIRDEVFHGAGVGIVGQGVAIVSVKHGGQNLLEGGEGTGTM